MWKDPIVEEVRRFRDEHAARFNYDIDAIVQDLQELDRVSGRQVVSFAPIGISRFVRARRRQTLSI